MFLSLLNFLNTIFVSSHIHSENPEGTQVIVGSMNMGYISDTARNRTHNLFRPMREPIPLGHTFCFWISVFYCDLHSIRYINFIDIDFGFILEYINLWTLTIGPAFISSLRLVPLPSSLLSSYCIYFSVFFKFCNKLSFSFSFKWTLFIRLVQIHRNVPP